MSLQRRLMSLGGGVYGCTRINFEYVDEEGSPIESSINPTLSFDSNTWLLNDLDKVFIENEKEVTIEYPKISGYDSPTNSSFYTDGITKDLKIVYTKQTINPNGYDYIDLGLSVLWATCNIGAARPEDYGDYYCWGGRTNKSASDYYAGGETDLPIEYDTARNKMGGDWRMPTRGEFEELINNTNYSWTRQNNVQGYRFTSKKNSQTLFFPAAGYYNQGEDVVNANFYGIYWSRSWGDSGNVGNLIFISNTLYLSNSYLGSVQSVRGVLPK